jgi:hypothetical protein
MASNRFDGENWSDRERVAIRALISDVAGTIGPEFESVVHDAAVLLRLSSPPPQRFDELLVERVQQVIHDDFIDTGWPRCPDHPNHPLWFDHGWWTCATTGTRAARLGDLTRSSKCAPAG